jgi:hypothetical protein
MTMFRKQRVVMAACCGEEVTKVRIIIFKSWIVDDKNNDAWRAIVRPRPKRFVFLACVQRADASRMPSHRRMIEHEVQEPLEP